MDRSAEGDIEGNLIPKKVDAKSNYYEVADERTALLAKGEQPKVWLEGGEKDEHRVLQLSEFINANSPWWIFFSSCLNAGLNLLAVSGAFFFVMASWEDIMPSCWKHEGASSAADFMCHATTFCFWTYPIICPMVMVLVIWRNVLQTRLYYECLLNEMLVDFESSAATNPGVWFILLWGLLAFGMVFFENSPLPMTKFVFSLLAYWAPIITFLMFLFKNWSIENFLIPLPCYCSTDPEYAGKVFHHACKCFVPESYMQLAFINMSERFGMENGKPKDTSEFFGTLKEEIIKEMEACGGLSEYETYVPESMVKPLGLVERPPYRSRFSKISRPEVLTMSYNLIHGYWVSNVLFSGFLKDARSACFRLWAYAFLFIVFLSAMMFAFFMVRTTATFMVWEHLAGTDGWAGRLMFHPH